MSRWVLVEFLSEEQANEFLQDDPSQIAWGDNGWDISHMNEYFDKVMIGEIRLYEEGEMG